MSKGAPAGLPSDPRQMRTNLHIVRVGDCFQKTRTIAKKVRLAIKTVTATLCALVQGGWVTATPREGKTTLYRQRKAKEYYFPAWIDDLGMTALRTLVVGLFLVAPTISRRQIAKTLHISVSTVDRAIADLVARGYLRIEPTPGKANRYVLVYNGEDFIRNTALVKPKRSEKRNQKRKNKEELKPQCHPILDRQPAPTEKVEQAVDFLSGLKGQLSALGP